LWEKPSDLLIFNGKNPELLLKWSTNADFSETLITRIAHQLEQRCRDVDPVAYSKRNKELCLSCDVDNTV
jgi:hypothetical protein